MSNLVAVCVHATVVPAKESRGSFEDGIQQLQHARSCSCSHSRKDKGLDGVGPSDDLAWTFQPVDLADRISYLWRIRILWIDLKVEGYRVISVEGPRRIFYDEG